MPVTRRQIIARGLAEDCPNCGEHTLFPPGAHFRINEECAHCGLKFNRGEGFFLGPLVINYTGTVLIFIIPVILLSAAGMIGMRPAMVTAGLGAVLLPLLFYRWSWSGWLMAYFFFLPQKLPANRDKEGEDREE
jgi:uncharacterized protein (DUF983 family)